MISHPHLISELTRKASRKKYFIKKTKRFFLSFPSLIFREIQNVEKLFFSCQRREKKGRRKGNVSLLRSLNHTQSERACEMQQKNIIGSLAIHHRRFLADDALTHRVLCNIRECTRASTINSITLGCTMKNHFMCANQNVYERHESDAKRVGVSENTLGWLEKVFYMMKRHLRLTRNVKLLNQM